MKPEEDASGQEIWAYYKGREVFEIWERDDGYISASSTEPKKYFSEYGDWPLHEKRAMEFVKGNVLDVGCGAGRHSLYLQNKGFNVLGIDSSPLAIKVCKLRGVKRAQVMSIENAVFSAEPHHVVYIPLLDIIGQRRPARHPEDLGTAQSILSVVFPINSLYPKQLEYVVHIVVCLRTEPG